MLSYTRPSRALAFGLLTTLTLLLPRSGFATLPPTSAFLGAFPGYPYEESFLLELECATVGANLVVVNDPTARSGEYVSPGTAFFPDTDPGNDPDNYITVDNKGVPIFRVRQNETGPVDLWLRPSGGEWELFSLTDSTRTTEADDWRWYPDYYRGAVVQTTDLLYQSPIDIAFTAADQQLDQIYSEGEYGHEKEFIRPFFSGFGLQGTNCPDFVNQPPLVTIDQYDSEYFGSAYLNLCLSNTDPDDQITRYTFDAPGAFIEEDYENAPCAIVSYSEPGDYLVTVTVTDYYGLATSRDIPFRGIPIAEDSERTAFRLQGECGATGAYWQEEAGNGYSGAALARGGSGESLSTPPADLPENQLSFTVTDVAANDAGRYFLAAVFDSPVDLGNCLWVQVNGTAWNRWDIYETENSYYSGPAFDLQAGDNTITFAYCNAQLGVDQLLLSPDSQFPGIFDNYPSGVQSPVIEVECASDPSDPCATNLAPIAVLQPGDETPIEFDYILFGGDSYDPDGEIEEWVYVPFGFGTQINETAEVAFDVPGDTLVRLTVFDNCGATGKDSVLFRVIPDSPASDRNVYRLQGECVATGDYWTVAEQDGAYNDAIAQGGSQESYDDPPQDLPENQLRFILQDVPASDAGRYYLFGGFTSPLETGSCLWTRINGGAWNSWNIIRPDRSYYPGPAFDLTAGDNLIEFAYCSPDLGVDQLFLSPDTRVRTLFQPDIYNRNGEIIDVDCPDGTSEFWLEAECAQVGNRWQVISETDASRGEYVVFPKGNAYGSPPADLPENFVRFEVENAEAGTYQLQARVKAPTVADDSYYVRVNDGLWYAWKSGLRSTTFSWKLLPGGGLELGDGTNTVDFAFREDGTQLDKIYLGTSSSMISGSGEAAPECTDVDPNTFAVWLEAECADYGSSWSLGADGTASNSAYLVHPSGNALSTPPADLPENIIRFEFNADEEYAALPLFLYGLVDAASNQDDSYWIRFNGGPWYAWKSIKDGPLGFQWNRLPIPLHETVAGANTLDFAYREDGARLDGIYVSTEDRLPEDAITDDPACNGSDPEPIAFEAECGIPGGGWSAIGSGQGAYNLYAVYEGDRQLSAPTANVPEQEMVFDVEVPTTGTYHLHLRMNAPSISQNSIWVQVDDGAWIKMWEEIGGAQLLTDGFEWRKVNDDGTDVSFNLTTGTHTLHIANREPGLAIDQLYLSVNPEGPTDFIFGNFVGGTADCSDPFRAYIEQSELTSQAKSGADQEIELYPNPVLDELSLGLKSAYSGRVQATIYDTGGQRLKDFNFDKPAGFLLTRLSVGDIPPGVYRLQVIEDDQQTVRSFIRM